MTNALDRAHIANAELTKRLDALRSEAATLRHWLDNATAEITALREEFGRVARAFDPADERHKRARAIALGARPDDWPEPRG